MASGLPGISRSVHALQPDSAQALDSCKAATAALIRSTASGTGMTSHKVSETPCTTAFRARTNSVGSRLPLLLFFYPIISLYFCLSCMPMEPVQASRAGTLGSPVLPEAPLGCARSRYKPCSSSPKSSGKIDSANRIDEHVISFPAPLRLALFNSHQVCTNARHKASACLHTALIPCSGCLPVRVRPNSCQQRAAPAGGDRTRPF